MLSGMGGCLLVRLKVASREDPFFELPSTPTSKIPSQVMLIALPSLLFMLFGIWSLERTHDVLLLKLHAFVGSMHMKSA